MAASRRHSSSVRNQARLGGRCSSEGWPSCSPGCTSLVPDSATTTTSDNARQVTVFGVLATPNAKTVDSRLSNIIQSQLDKLLPKNGFKLLDARSESHRRRRIDNLQPRARLQPDDARW